MRRALFLMYLFVPFALLAQEDEDWEWHPEDYPPMYYKETPFGYEKLDSLPTIVLRDTVYVADIDAFLRGYVGDSVNLNTLLEDVSALQTLVDSLGKLSAERLYFNFFMPSDSLDIMSGSFVVRELSIDDELAPRTSATREPLSRTARREILLRIDGTERTSRFIGDQTAIRRAISRLFAEMQNDSKGIRGIGIYLPEYNFTHRREMVQFVKSVRIMMDASRDFKFGTPSVGTPLTVFFRADSSRVQHPDFIYSLCQEASSVVFLDDTAPEKLYTRGKSFESEDWDHAGVIFKIRGHLPIARFYTGSLDIRAQQVTDFSEENIREILAADYPENRWEIFALIFLLILVLLGVFGILYRGNALVSLFVNHHVESVMLVLMVVVLELGVLLVTVFQNMCGDDKFSLLERHPIVIFLLPLVIVLAAPLVHNILKNRKMP